MKLRNLIILVCILGFLSFGCNRGNEKLPGSVVNVPNTASGKVENNTLPVMKFDNVEHDFGKVIEGEIVTYSFKFRNEGNADLVIANISTSCGCTATEYPKTPVKPGAEDFIKVSFDSQGRNGFQTKTITVGANTQPSITILKITAKVFQPEKE